MSTQSHTVGTAVVDALLAEGVETIFGLPGSHVLPIYDALRDAPAIRHITVKHENNAALMADMYGRLTRRPGVCLVTAGPGATNSISGVAQAFTVASPVVHLSGTVPVDADREAFHGVEKPDFLYRMFTDITKWSVRVERFSDLPAVLAEAFHLATSGRPGPVHVELPLRWDEPETVEARPYQRRPPVRFQPDRAALDRIASTLRAARAPVIAAGPGVLATGASRELVDLAERLSAPVVYPLYEAGVIPDDHPLSAGYFYAWVANPFAYDLLRDADVVLSVGFLRETESVHILRRHLTGRHLFIAFDDTGKRVADAAVDTTADTRLALCELIERLRGRTVASGDQLVARLAEYRQAAAETKLQTLEEYESLRPMHFGLAVRELANHLDPDAIVVGDVSNGTSWLQHLLTVRAGMRLILPGRWGEMGFALPGAIAAKLVHPDRQVVGVTGDGCLLMSLSDLGTAVTEQANIVLVVLSDHQYGMIHNMQTSMYGGPYATFLGTPDLVKLAESVGLAGFRVEDPADLADAFAQACAAGRPALVEVIAHHDVPAPSLTRPYARFQEAK